MSSYFLIVTIVTMADKSGVPKEKQPNKKKKLDLKPSTTSVKYVLFLKRQRYKKHMRITTGYHSPIHDKSTSEKHKYISDDLNQIRQILTKIRGTMVKQSVVKVWDSKSL